MIQLDRRKVFFAVYLAPGEGAALRVKIFVARMHTRIIIAVATLYAYSVLLTVLPVMLGLGLDIEAQGLGLQVPDLDLGVVLEAPDLGLVTLTT